MEIDEILGESQRMRLPTKIAIYVMGLHESGQMGRMGEEKSLRIPRKLPPELFGCPAAGGNSRWLYVACGRVHTAAVASNGSLFTWGANDFGQLGDWTERGRKYPKKVKQLHSEFVISVSRGAHCTTAIAEPRENDGSMSTRRLCVWGQNLTIHKYMEMSCNSQRILRMLGILPVDWCVGEVRKLAAGGGHSALLTDACSLKELCEFRLADSVTLSNAYAIEDATSRTGSDAFVRLCEDSGTIFSMVGLRR